MDWVCGWGGHGCWFKSLTDLLLCPQLPSSSSSGQRKSSSWSTARGSVWFVAVSGLWRSFLLTASPLSRVGGTCGSTTPSGACCSPPFCWSSWCCCDLQPTARGQSVLPRELNIVHIGHLHTQQGSSGFKATNTPPPVSVDIHS